MGLAAWLLLAAACREINPDYDGPVASSGATETAGTESEPTAGSSGATADDAAASGSEGAPPSTSSGEPGSSSDAPGDDDGCMGMNCAGECVDVQTDDDHCGMCNHKCNGQKECIAGECRNP